MLIYSTGRPGAGRLNSVEMGNTTRRAGEKYAQAGNSATFCQGSPDLFPFFRQ